MCFLVLLLLFDFPFNPFIFNFTPVVSIWKKPKLWIQHYDNYDYVELWSFYGITEDFELSDIYFYWDCVLLLLLFNLLRLVWSRYPQGSIRIFCLFWVVFLFTFFSVVQFKTGLYMYSDGTYF